MQEVSQEEIEDYLELQYYNSFRVALGAMLCINSPVVAILVDGFDMGGLIPSGAAELFEGMSLVVLLAIAVCLYLYSAIRTGKWDYLKEKKCHVDERTLYHIKMEKIISRRTHARFVALGVLIFLFSFIPWIVFPRIGPDFLFMDNLKVALFLVILSMGVFLIIMALYMEYIYSSLLNINNREPQIRGRNGSEGDSPYGNILIEKGMSVFWPTVLCIYLSMSFLTFAWDISWIIWPVAWITSEFINRVFLKTE